jgi:YidC/Oxa1 family membrane protein insertase
MTTMLELFNAAFYNPIYNALILIVSELTVGDVGLAIIVLTITVKLILFPLSLKAAKTQILMREIEPALKALKETYKDNKEELALKTLALYREKGVNPFSAIGSAFIQLPIIIALYMVFFYEKLPEVNTEILYGFVSAPETVNLMLFGLIDVTKVSYVLAMIAGITQYYQVRLAMPPVTMPKKGEPSTFAEDFGRSMQIQMQYVLPVIITLVSFTIAAAISLYFVVSNLFAIGQEWYIRRTIKNKSPEQAA